MDCLLGCRRGCGQVVNDCRTPGGYVTKLRARAARSDNCRANRRNPASDQPVTAEEVAAGAILRAALPGSERLVAHLEASGRDHGQRSDQEPVTRVKPRPTPINRQPPPNGPAKPLLPGRHRLNLSAAPGQYRDAICRATPLPADTPARRFQIDCGFRSS
jgi:hypothetical protein